jgi:hypothetical protein
MKLPLPGPLTLTMMMAPAVFAAGAMAGTAGVLGLCALRRATKARAERSGPRRAGPDTEDEEVGA